MRLRCGRWRPSLPKRNALPCSVTSMVSKADNSVQRNVRALRVRAAALQAGGGECGTVDERRLRGRLSAAQSSVQRLCLRVIEPTPAATFNPLSPDTLSGCSANDLSNPPTKAFAPTPTPSVALALPP